jgi:drug/metabolite transporter (DMT)-like permease
MRYLLPVILANVSFMFIFKLYERHRVQTFQAIVVNYLTCFVVGLVVSTENLPILIDGLGQPWFWLALVLGALFIGTFYLIALTAQRMGITVASVATKISLVIPVLFSLLVLQTSLKDYTLLNYLGMGVALVAVLLTSIRTKPYPPSGHLPQLTSFGLPFLIFLNTGIGDVLINYSNHALLQPHQAGAFTMLTFGASAGIGVVMILYRISTGHQQLKWKSVPAGIMLGLPNFFSIFFLFRALSAFGNDGAFLFPVNNIGIILLGTLGAVLFFRERLTPLNLAGIALALLALILLSYQEIAIFIEINN